jgi:hypothetical protein
MLTYDERYRQARELLALSADANADESQLNAYAPLTASLRDQTQRR